MACGKRTAISQNGPVGFESSTLTKTPKDRFAEHASSPTKQPESNCPAPTLGCADQVQLQTVTSS